MTSNIVQKSMAFVKQLFDASQEPLHYHNWDHTMDVYAAAKKIADNTKDISDENKEALEIAAIFHDVAQTSGSDNHESESALIAENFLADNQYSTERISLVKRLIMATKLGYEPTDCLEGIIKDADLSHLANDEYLSTTYQGLYNELKAKKCIGSPKSWAKKSKEFMTNCGYYSNYAKDNFEEGKLKNINKLEEQIQTEEVIAGEAEALKKKKKKKKKEESPIKGVETMFRVALRNHMTLSQIADNKANTLISVNGIIITVVLSALFPKLDSHPYLIYPGFCLLLVSIITIILSILSTIPKTTSGMITRSEVEEKKGNLLFFGNFHQMSLRDYEWGIDELMADKDYLYKSLTRDLYFLGKVLKKKYTLLRYSYYVFVLGLVTSIILFVVNIRGII